MSLPAPSEIAPVPIAALPPVMAPWVAWPTDGIAAAPIVALPAILDPWPFAAPAPNSFIPVVALPPTAAAAAFSATGTGVADDRFVISFDAPLRDVVTIQAVLVQ